MCGQAWSTQFDVVCGLQICEYAICDLNFDCQHVNQVFLISTLIVNKLAFAVGQGP